MALSVNKPRTYGATRPDAYTGLPVEAAAVIYQGSAVGLDGGYVQALTAGDVFAGFAEEYVDNSGGADGAKRVRVIQRGILKRVSVTGISSVANLTQQPVYMSDNDTLTTTSTSNSLIGRAVKVWDDGTVDVAFGPSGDSV